MTKTIQARLIPGSFLKFTSIILLCLLSSCAGPHISQSELDNLPTRQAQFRDGTADLDCGLGCAGREGAASRTLFALYNLQDWVNLSNEILTINSNDDESWYYLGRAAEGLGYYPAAEHYYTEALSAPFKCHDGLINICNGLDIPALVQAHLAILAQKMPPGATLPEIPADTAPEISAAASAPGSELRVPLVNEDGELTVPVVINNILTLQFVVDSGATSVGLPDAVVVSLIHDGSLKKSDILGVTHFMLADGTTGKALIFHIHSLQVGGIVLKNIIAANTGPRGGLILGQSFLNHFKSWSVDNNNKALILQ